MKQKFIVKHHKHGWFKLGTTSIETSKNMVDKIFDPPFEIWVENKTTGHRSFLAGRRIGESWSDEINQ